MIFKDYGPEVTEQCTAYWEVMSTLYKRGLNPSLLYPVRLCIMTKDEGIQYFTSVEDHDGRPLLTTHQEQNRLLKNKSTFCGHGGPIS